MTPTAFLVECERRGFALSVVGDPAAPKVRIKGDGSPKVRAQVQQYVARHKAALLPLLGTIPAGITETPPHVSAAEPVAAPVIDTADLEELGAQADAVFALYEAAEARALPHCTPPLALPSGRLCADLNAMVRGLRQGLSMAYQDPDAPAFTSEGKPTTWSEIAARNERDVQFLAQFLAEGWEQEREGWRGDD